MEVYPLVNIHIAIENGHLPIFIVDLPIHSMAIFHSYIILVYQRVSIVTSCCDRTDPWFIADRRGNHPQFGLIISGKWSMTIYPTTCNRFGNQRLIPGKWMNVQALSCCQLTTHEYLENVKQIRVELNRPEPWEAYGLGPCACAEEGFKIQRFVAAATGCSPRAFGSRLGMGKNRLAV